MGAAATFAKAGAVAGVAVTAVAGPALVQHRPAAPVAAKVVPVAPPRTPVSTRPTPPLPELVAARVGGGDDRPPTATPEPRRAGKPKTVRTTETPRATTRSQSRRNAGDDARSGDRDDDEVTTRRRAEQDDGEREASDVPRSGDKDDGETQRSTETPRTRDEAVSGGGEDDGAERSSGDSRESDSEQSEPRALAVAEPEGSDDDEADPGAAPVTDDRP
jgi:hypothetical protein